MKLLFLSNVCLYNILIIRLYKGITFKVNLYRNINLLIFNVYVEYCGDFLCNKALILTFSVLTFVADSGFLPSE